MADLVKIKNGDLDLVASGTMIINADNIVTFTLTDDGDPIHLEFKFENKEDDPKASQTFYDASKERTTGIVFYNYNNIFGLWSPKPILIAGLFEREVYMYWHITGLQGDPKMNSNLKRLDYSFYLGKSIDFDNPGFKKTESNG